MYVVDIVWDFVGGRWLSIKQHPETRFAKSNLFPKESVRIKR